MWMMSTTGSAQFRSDRSPFQRRYRNHLSSDRSHRKSHAQSAAYSLLSLTENFKRYLWSCQQYITAHGRLAPPIIIRDARGDLSPVFRTTAFRTEIFPQVVIIRERKSGTVITREAFKILRRLISDLKQRIPSSTHRTRSTYRASQDPRSLL